MAEPAAAHLRRDAYIYVRQSTLAQTIRMAQLVRGAAGACDTVQLSDWTHTMNAVDGTLARSLSNVRSYQVKSTSSGVTSCAG